MNRKITICRAEKQELKTILDIQRLAFQREAEEYNDFLIEPLTQSLEEVEKEFEYMIFLKAIDENGKIIGSTRGFIENGTSYIRTTSVHPDYQGIGIGSKLIQALEEVNLASRYEISASIRCPQNIKLYEKLGFVRFKEIKTENNGFIYLEK